MVCPYLKNESISILEIGFGTWFKCIYYPLKSIEMNQAIQYVGVEVDPVSSEELSSMNYVRIAENKRAIFNNAPNSNASKTRRTIFIN
jgi:hypothetical protein